MGKPKDKKTLKQCISNVVFGIVMAFLGLIVIFSVLEKTTGFSIGGRHLIWVKTSSMEPTIPASSYILVKDCKAEDVKTGDVIMFISDDPAIKGQNNTHRVQEITSEGEFVTKGDNNIIVDNYTVKPENVLAKYERNLPFLTFFGRLNTTPAGLVLSLGTAFGLFGVWFTIDINERKKESKKQYMNELVQQEVARLENEAKEKERINENGKESR